MRYAVKRAKSKYGPAAVLARLASKVAAQAAALKARAQLRKAGYRIKVSIGAVKSNPTGKTSRFKHTKVASPRAFDKRSFRYIKRGKNRILIGCPKGQWMPRKKRCKVGTRAVAVLKPKATRKKNPSPVSIQYVPLDNSYVVLWRGIVIKHVKTKDQAKRYALKLAKGMA